MTDILATSEPPTTQPPPVEEEPAVEVSTRLRPPVLILAFVLLVAAVLLGILVGPVSIPPGGAIVELIDRLPVIDLDSGLTVRETDILWQIRFPRVVLGALVGATLALAGAAYQGVFRNALADPFLLGVAAGAGLGATIAFSRAAAAARSSRSQPSSEPCWQWEPHTLWAEALAGDRPSHWLSPELRSRRSSRRSRPTCSIAPRSICAAFTHGCSADSQPQVGRK